MKQYYEIVGFHQNVNGVQTPKYQAVETPGAWLTRSQVHDFALHIANRVESKGWINAKVLGDALDKLFPPNPAPEEQG